MLTPKQRHRLLMADRTHDAGWVAAVIENMLAADSTVILAEVEAALRDAAAYSYVIGGPGKFSIVIGMPAMLAAVAEARVTAAETGRRWGTHILRYCRNRASQKPGRISGT